jgi:predicted transcriptional regulator
MKRYHFISTTSAIGYVTLPPIDAATLAEAWARVYETVDLINADDNIHTNGGHIYVSIDNETLTVNGVVRLDEHGVALPGELPEGEW